MLNTARGQAGRTTPLAPLRVALRLMAPRPIALRALLATCLVVTATAAADANPATAGAAATAYSSPGAVTATPAQSGVVATGAPHATPPTSAGSAAAASTSAPGVASSAAPETARPPLWPRVKERASGAWKTAVGLVFEEWPSPLFEKHFWNTTLAGLRVVSPLVVALLLLLRWVVDRGHGRVPPTVQRRSARLLTGFGLLLYYGAFNPNVRHPGLYDPTSFYHDYLGTKYQSELDDAEQAGSWLGDCTLAAEKELGRSSTFAQRQVFTQSEPGRRVPAATVAAVHDPLLCSSRFSTERWAAFRADVGWFAGAVQPAVWAEVTGSRPEPTSPGFRLLAAPFVSPAASEGYFRTLAWLGVTLHVATLAALDASFGPITAAVVSVAWSSQPFFPLSGGVGLLHGVALSFWLCGLAAWRKDRPWLGGAALGLGTLALPWTALGLVPWAVATWRRSPAKRWSTERLAGALALGLTLIGGAVVGGVTPSARSGSYQAYAEQLEQRVSRPALDDVGLAAVFTNHGESRYRFLRNDAAPDPAEDWSLLRGKRADETRWARGVVLALLLVVLCLLAWRASPLWGATLGLLLAPLSSQPLSVSFGFIPLALLSARRTEWAVPTLIAVAGTALLNNQLAFVDDRAAAISSVLWLTTACVVCGLWRRKPAAASHRTTGTAAVLPPSGNDAPVAPRGA